MSFKVVIPARYASTRLPGKPLLDIAGKPMVIRVAEQAVKSGANEVIIATDFEEIVETARHYKIRALMTRADHQSGTDRISEVAQLLAWSDDEIVVNVQGDEPLIDPELIRQLAHQLSQSKDAVMATACHPIHQEADLLNPNVVKVVMNEQGYAMYFSRAAIPYPRDTASKQNLQALRHIGIYAYRVSFLKQFSTLATTELEKIESLEQLRVLYHGYKIAMIKTEKAPATGVDTYEDLLQVRTILSKR